MNRLTWLAAGCVAAGAVTAGCMFQPSGTEVVGQVPAPDRDTPSDASLINVDTASGPDAGRPGSSVPDAGPGPAAGVNGAACAQPGQCGSGFCVGGICCDQACTGQCQSCNLPGMKGTCAATLGPPPPGRGSCMGAGTPCAGACNGTSSGCRYPGTDTECAPARCADAVAQTRSVCSGAGVCVPGPTVPCAPFSCDGALCAGGCGPGRPCLAGNYCSGGRCFPLRDNGGGCDTGDQCNSGACVDGRCCSVAACGVCAACVGPAGTCQMVVSAPDSDTCSGTEMCGPDGQCRKSNGQACLSNATCLSGFCVSGLCCDTACTGSCESCAGPGAAGACQPVPLDADAKNCGRCGNVCSTNHITATCRQGLCGGLCQLGFSDCNANPGADGCEVNTAADSKNCGGCGHTCPGTTCSAGVCEKIAFSWSAMGALTGKFCLAITEAADPDGWTDNYLCAQRDFGFKWSSAGPIAGMVCTQWLEPADPHGWNDNYLCAPVDYGLRWSAAGPIAGLRCTQILEPADPGTWTDNYLCVM